MTGAFFWIGQLLILVNFYDNEIPHFLNTGATLLTGFNAGVPPAFSDISATLLTTFGIIGIFVTGLILDLLGAPYTIFENHILNSNLRKHKSWLDPVLRDASPDLYRCYKNIETIFKPKNLFLPNKSMERLRHLGECKQIQSFLFSYIHVYSSNSTSDLLTDNMHLWRTSRAISTTLLILAIEILFIRGGEQIDTLKTALYGLMILLALLLTIVSYGRMCHTLFTLACATNNKHLHS